jgi:putative N6-adenine-specific DNA methylase
VSSDIELRQQPISALELPEAIGHVVTNPPYGVRVGDSAPLRNLYAQLGNVMRSRAHGWTLAMLVADRALERQTGIAFDEMLRTTNGGLAVRLVRATIA